MEKINFRVPGKGLRAADGGEGSWPSHLFRVNTSLSLNGSLLARGALHTITAAQQEELHRAQCDPELLLTEETIFNWEDISIPDHSRAWEGDTSILITALPLNSMGFMLFNSHSLSQPICIEKYKNKTSGHFNTSFLAV